MKRFILFGVVALLGLGLDQWSKRWAVDALAHTCPVRSTKGDDMAPAISHCHDERPVIFLREPAAQLLLMTSDSDGWRLRCNEGKACLRGAITLGGKARDAESVGSLRKLGPGASYWLRAVDGKKYGSVRFTYERIAPPLVLIDGYLSLEYAENRGAAWNLLADQPGLREPVLIGIAGLAVLLLAYWVYRLRPEQRLLAVGLGLLFSGTVGNLIDRVRFGYVIDFIVFTIRDSFRWPTFNVADAAIVFGVAILVIDSVRGFVRDRRKRNAGDKPQGASKQA